MSRWLPHSIVRLRVFAFSSVVAYLSDSQICLGSAGSAKLLPESGVRGTMSEGGKGGCHGRARDRKSTRLNSSHLVISYAVFCLKKKKRRHEPEDTNRARENHLCECTHR